MFVCWKQYQANKMFTYSVRYYMCTIIIFYLAYRKNSDTCENDRNLSKLGYMSLTARQYIIVAKDETIPIWMYCNTITS